MFEDGRFARALGRGIHRVLMTDWRAGSYVVDEVAPSHGEGSPLT